MEKKSLKDAVAIRPKDEFVNAAPSGDTAPSPQGDKSLKRQITKSPKPRPVRVAFYWDPQTEKDIEELRLKLLKEGRKLTRSELVEGLVKGALKNEKTVEGLL